MLRVTTEKRLYKTALLAPKFITEQQICRKIPVCSRYTSLQGSTITHNKTPKIDANGITPTLDAGPDFFIIEDLLGLKSDADDASDTVENSDTDEEKPLEGGKALRVKTVYWERERRIPGGCVLFVSDINLTLSS